MLRSNQILVSTGLRRLALAACMAGLLAGCGQKGALFLPTGEAADNRATLPETLRGASPATQAASAPRSGAANPVRNP
jgi:predicted small lipoprotein YifL